MEKKTRATQMAADKKSMAMNKKGMATSMISDK